MLYLKYMAFIYLQIIEAEDDAVWSKSEKKFIVT